MSKTRIPVPVPVRTDQLERTMKQFDHERLDVYRVSIDFVALANELVEKLPRGRAYLTTSLDGRHSPSR